MLEWLAAPEDDRDFVWPGTGFRVALGTRAAETFDGVAGWRPGPVEVVRGTAPRLVELIPELIHADLDRSSLILGDECDSCGRLEWRMDGLGRDAQGNPAPRRPGAGLYVTAEELDGYDVFRVHELPAWIVVTDSLRDVVEGHALGPVEFGDARRPRVPPDCTRRLDLLLDLGVRDLRRIAGLPNGLAEGRAAADDRLRRELLRSDA